MKNNLKIKINGICVKSLFLGLSLLKNNNEIYFFDSIKTNTKSNYKDKFFAITNSTKVILEELKIWENLETKMYGFKYLSIYDKPMSKEKIFNYIDLYPKSEIIKNIGWTIKYEELKELLLKKLSIDVNVNFLKNDDNYFSQSKFDYEFFFGEFYKEFSKRNIKNLFNYPKSYSSMVFKLMVRSDFDERAYKIFLKNESITMIPLAENIYQIIWNASTKKLKSRYGLNINLFLDNFSTMLPNGFKTDQIIGDLNLLSNPSSLSNILKFHNNRICINEFSEISSQLTYNELGSFLMDLKILNKNLLINKKSKANYFWSLKIRFYINKFLICFKSSIINITSLKFLKIIFLMHNLLINSFVFRFVKLPTNSIFKLIFLGSIK